MYIHHAQVIFARFKLFVRLLTIELRERSNEDKQSRTQTNHQGRDKQSA